MGTAGEGSRHRKESVNLKTKEEINPSEQQREN